MALTIGEASAINTLVMALTGRAHPVDEQPITLKQQQAAIDLLIPKAHKVLMAGLRPGEVTVQPQGKPGVVVIENPQEDPSWFTYGGDVEVMTVSSYPFSKYAEDNEAYEATRSYLTMLRDGQGPADYLDKLRDWLEMEIDHANLDFEVDWERLRIVGEPEEG